MKKLGVNLKAEAWILVALALFFFLLLHFGVSFLWPFTMIEQIIITGLLVLAFETGCWVSNYLLTLKYAGASIAINDVKNGEYYVLDILMSRFGSMRTVKLCIEPTVGAIKDVRNIADPNKVIPNEYIGKIVFMRNGKVVEIR